MFHGPIAAAGLLEAPASGGGATTVIDFVAGTYTIDGASYTAADIVSDTSTIGASGLHAGDGGPISIIGDLLTALTALDWTLLLEYEELYARAVTYVLELGDGGTQELAVLRDDVVSTFLSINAFESSDPSGYRQDRDPASGDGPFGIGVHRIALTRTATKFVLSADGRPIVSDTSVPGTIAPTLAGFGGMPGAGGWFGNDCYIRRLTIYPPKDDADLPSLSA